MSTIETSQQIAVASTVVVLLAALFLVRLLFIKVVRPRIRSFGPSILSDEPGVGGLVKITYYLEIAAMVGLVVIALLVSLSAADILAESGREHLEKAGLAVLDWLRTVGVKITLIVLISYLLHRALNRVIPFLLRRQLLGDKTGIELEESGKRLNALLQVGRFSSTTAVLILGGLTFLSQIGITVGPLIAALGIVGLAVGFGAQHSVRDVISGLFIVGENQYGVGDVAAVGGKIGLVEGVNLRRTVLRDLDGIVHVIPNGEISTSSNYTRNFSRVNLDISVAYKEDLDHVIRVINRIGTQLAQDDYFINLIIEPPQVLRVNAFEDSGIAIKVLGVTKPIRQWEVMGELRRRIKREFDRQGIEIPLPHRTLYWGPGAHPRSAPVEALPAETHTPSELEAADPPADPWAALQVAALNNNRTSRDLMAHTEEVVALSQQRPFALFTDIDGTLARISSSPGVVKVVPAVRQALGNLSRWATVVILTSRSLESARAVLGLNSVIYVANSGLETWQRGKADSVKAARSLSN